MALNLKDIWIECTAELPEDVAESWWKELHKNYSDASRPYNNIQLLEKKLSDYLLVKSCLQHPNAVALAIFFNSFDYNPKVVDNYSKNMAAFEKFAEEATIAKDSPLHQQVVGLLQAAATHSTDEHKIDGVFGTEDRHYFLDIDMSPLGFSPEEYGRYSSEVQQAFSSLPIAGYRSFRLRVLECFLQIPNTFATEEFRTKYEKQARINMKNEVELLKS